MDQKDIKRIEKHFVEICLRDKIRYGSKRFYDYQSAYFCGAMTASKIALMRWKIMMQVDRPVMTKEQFINYGKNTIDTSASIS